MTQNGERDYHMEQKRYEIRALIHEQKERLRVAKILNQVSRFDFLEKSIERLQQCLISDRV